MLFRSAGAPAAIRLTADRTEMAADGQSLSFIAVEVVDGDGLVVPTADARLTFALQGPAELLAAGNADIKDDDPYFDTSHRAFQGRALAVVRSGRRGGKVTLTVSADGLSAGKAVVILKK